MNGIVIWQRYFLGHSLSRSRGPSSLDVSTVSTRLWLPHRSRAIAPLRHFRLGRNESMTLRPKSLVTRSETTTLRAERS